MGVIFSADFGYFNRHFDRTCVGHFSLESFRARERLARFIGCRFGHRIDVASREPSIRQSDVDCRRYFIFDGIWPARRLFITRSFCLRFLRTIQFFRAGIVHLSRSNFLLRTQRNLVTNFKSCRRTYYVAIKRRRHDLANAARFSFHARRHVCLLGAAIAVNK